MIGRPRLLILDVEGSEVMVIRGGRSLISRHKPDIVVEANPTFLGALGFTVGELKTEIEQLGYSVVRIARVGLKKISATSFPGYQNWLCVSDESRMKLVHDCIRKCGLLPPLPGIHPLTRARSRSWNC
jgi:hypothetical protein